MKTVMITLALLLCAVGAQAQTASPANKLGWTQTAQSQPVAQGASYTLYDGAVTPGTVLSGVVCVANGANVDCVATFPALTPGTHNLTLTQSISGAESPKSTPLSLTFVVVVTPTNLSIK